MQGWGFNDLKFVQPGGTAPTPIRVQQETPPPPVGLSGGQAEVTNKKTILPGLLHQKMRRRYAFLPALNATTPDVAKNGPSAHTSETFRGKSEFHDAQNLWKSQG